MLNHIKQVKINFSEFLDHTSSAIFAIDFYKQDDNSTSCVECIEAKKVTFHFMGTYFSSNFSLLNTIVNELEIVRNRDKDKFLSYCLNPFDPADNHILLQFTYRKEKGTFEMIMRNVAGGNSVDLNLATFSYPNQLKRLFDTILDVVDRTMLQLTYY